jgi:hypothetical protein
MVPKYIVSLAVTVVVVSLACCALPFVDHARVRSGTVTDEIWYCTFTIDAPNNQTYTVDDQFKAELEKEIAFVGSGPVYIASENLEVTPQKVSWKEGDTNITADGASLVAHVKWGTDATAANGAAGAIRIDFSRLPKDIASSFNFHSGGYQKNNDDGTWEFREVTAYKNGVSLFLGRLALASSAGIPFAIFLHSIWWAVLPVAKEARARVAALTELQNQEQTHRIFYSSPTAEWGAWALALGIITGVASMIACFSIFDGFLSSQLRTAILVMVAVGVLIAAIAAFAVRASVLTILVDNDGLSYARGRGTLNWIAKKWADLLDAQCKSRTYKGKRSEWVVLKFSDQKNLKITEQIKGYPALRDIIMAQYSHQSPPLQG